MFVGLVTAFQIGRVAWDYFENPPKIVNLNDEIEERSHLNAFIASLKLSELVPKTSVVNAQPQVTDTTKVERSASPESPKIILNASYFAAWVILVFLLSFLVRIALLALVEGGKLAACSPDGDRQMKMVLNKLLEEVQKR